MAMPGETLTELLASLGAFVACVLWLTAGARLLFKAHSTRSRPDFLIGLGLLVGGALIGLTTMPLAGFSPFPVEALVLGAVIFWSTEGDEANGMQPGDIWLPVAAITGLGLTLHLCFAALGAQPVLAFGSFEIRPLEFPVLILLGYLWHRCRKGNIQDPQHLQRNDLRELLWTTAGASLAVFIGGFVADPFRFVLLSLAPLSFLIREFRSSQMQMRYFAAVAMACTLAFISLNHAQQSARHQLWLNSAMQQLSVSRNHHQALQKPVNMAVDTWAHEEPKKLYARANTAFQVDLGALANTFRQAAGAPSTVNEITQTFQAHQKWGQEVFAAIALRNAVWGDTAAAGREEARARSLHAECKLAHARGMAGIDRLQGVINGSLQQLGTQITKADSLFWSLLCALGLLGAVLLHKIQQQETQSMNPETMMEMRENVLNYAAIMAFNEKALAKEKKEAKPKHKVLVVDHSEQDRKQLQSTLEQNGLLVSLAEDSQTALDALAKESYDLVLMEMQSDDTDGFATTETLRQRNDQTPVVLMNGQPNAEEMQRSDAAGCNGFVQKPLAEESLTALLSEHFPSPATDAATTDTAAEED